MTFFKGLFSNRKKIQMSPSVLYKNMITIEVSNAINNCFEMMWESFANIYQSSYYGSSELCQKDIEKELWIHFLNRKLSDFDTGRGYYMTSLDVINDSNFTWYQKLDLIEFTIQFIDNVSAKNNYIKSKRILNAFISQLNYEFKRLDFAYRIVNNEIVEVNSDEEVQAITCAINESKDNVREHLTKALAHYSEKPNPDVRNSIKESISAVEAVCRELTGEQTLGKALKKLEDKGLKFHPMLKDSITKLYVYTNDQTTGIRHALMDTTGNYVPSKDEAYFMLISCCVFINYLRMKIAS